MKLSWHLIFTPRGKPSNFVVIFLSKACSKTLLKSQFPFWQSFSFPGPYPAKDPPYFRFPRESQEKIFTALNGRSSKCSIPTARACVLRSERFSPPITSFSSLNQTSGREKHISQKVSNKNTSFSPSPSSSKPWINSRMSRVALS